MIRTERLLLRNWTDDDREAYAALNADEEVRRWFPGTLAREESDRQLDRLRAAIERDGFGLWAAEAPGTAALIGFVGLQRVSFEARFTPAVEIGWRLARPFWGCGYATEGARAALADGFGRLGLDEIVSMTVPGNARSRRVMERLGMTRDEADDFDHPRIGDERAELRRHVLYRIRRAAAASEASSRNRVPAGAASRNRGERGGV